MVELDAFERLLPQSLANAQREVFWAAILVSVVTLWIVTSFSKQASLFPSINEGKSPWANLKARAHYVKNARQLLADGFRKFAGPFTVLTDGGRLIMLPPDMIEHVNATEDLSFKQYTREYMLADYESFRTFKSPPEGMFEEAVMKGLTRSLPKFTKALSNEMTNCLNDSWDKLDDGWHELNPRDDVLDWVARLSSRIFLPGPFAENKEWLRISIDFTTNCFIAIAICRFVPWPLRWTAERILPLCRKVRADYRAAARTLQPVLDERHKEIAAAEREGRKPNLPDDSIEWFRNASHGREYNEVDIQMGLAVAAIHTTSDLLVQSLLNLGAHPELLEPLREEAISVLRQHGLQKTALYELRLLDSFFKETQRLKPINMATMHRTATADVELSNGIKIARGQHTAISSHRMWSNEHYDNPDEFDAFRFFKRRQTPGLEHRSHLVATSPEHLGFSHGKHACPGRFFAANEVKISMLHLILKYDFELKDLGMAKWMEFGTAMVANPKAKIWLKRRQPEIDLEALASEA
ncbi:hypothetical protein PRZ48_011944 [Zasmidium cellare]|uniref:Cytochrome P450 n=1 Tax=Zasmidium cellare TaxID=395010 RepID=A0ABR0E7S8_ZASCE|nr:hypothetical protein PRZ48_011944 [Zasmidium cellare]